MNPDPQHRQFAARPRSWGLLRATIRRTLAVLVILVLLIGFAQPEKALGAEAMTAKEAQIKAAFVYNFTKFVDWPAEAFPEKSTPIAVGVMGNIPFIQELNKAVEGRRVNGREIQIRAVVAGKDFDGLHVLFVGGSESARFSEVLRPLQNKPVLTISEKESFIKEGGAISLLLDGDKVRFAINMAAAEAAGLKVSAQLQKLATNARKTP